MQKDTLFLSFDLHTVGANSAHLIGPMPEFAVGLWSLSSQLRHLCSTDGQKLPSTRRMLDGHESSARGPASDAVTRICMDPSRLMSAATERSLQEQYTIGATRRQTIIFLGMITIYTSSKLVFTLVG